MYNQSKQEIMKTFILVIVVLIAGSTSTIAQKNNHFEFELDPIAYAFGGISGHIAYTFKNQRIQLGYAQITVPKAYQNNKGITESFKAFPSIKWDIFFGKEDASHGFFAGPTINYLFTTYESDTDKTKGEGFNIGVRGGYKFNLFKNNKRLKGLYLTPWVGFSYKTGSSVIELDDQKYSLKSFTVFPTFHLGWSF